MLTTAVLLSGCGDKGREYAASSPAYTVAIERVSFPREQRLAERSTLRLTVRNVGRRTLPDVAVSVNAFGYRERRGRLADRTRPIWIVDATPRGSETAYVSTWALGSLRPGATKTFRWRVTAVRAGTHTLKYTVAADLRGQSETRLTGRAPAEGALTVQVR